MWMLPVFRCYCCVWQWATLMQITSLGDVERIWDSIKVLVSCKLSPLCPQGGVGHTLGQHSAQSSKIAHFKQSIKIFSCKYYNHILNACQVSWQWNFFLLISKYLYNSMNTVSKYNDNNMTHLHWSVQVLLIVLSTGNCRTWPTVTGRRSFLGDSSWHRTYSISLLWFFLVRWPL